LGGNSLSDEEARPEDNSDSEDKDSFSKFIHDNLNMDGMPDVPNTPTKSKDDEGNQAPPPPPTTPFSSRFGKSSNSFSRFGTPKSDDNFDDSDDDDPFTGSSNIFGKKSPFSGDSKDRPTPFGGSGSRFGGGSSSFGNSGSRFGGGNSENSPFNRFGSDKNPPPPPSPFSALGRLSTNKQPPSSFGQRFTMPKTPQQKRTELIRNLTQLFKDLLPSILLLLLLIYFITIFSQYQPDVLKNEIQQLQQTITQQENQIRQLQARLEAMSQER